MARSNQTDANNVETHTEATGISQVTAKSTPIAIFSTTTKNENALHEKIRRKMGCTHCENIQMSSLNSVSIGEF